MNPQNKTVVRISKRLSWLLRHGAGEVGLPMDAAGWAAVPAVLRELRISRSRLEESVAHNNKNRLQLVGERVRCCQGHSTETMPVTAEALEASWRVWTGSTAWHGTFLAAVEAIGAEGLVPQARTHVHLTGELESVVGKRANVHVMIEIDAAAMRRLGCELYEAPNGVILTRRVPPECFVGVRAMTRKAHGRVEALRAALGLQGVPPSASAQAGS
jgi:putative RNA 2'-phosphotransferase